MTSIKRIKNLLSEYDVDSLIVHHEVTKKRKAHILCIEALKKINGEFLGFLTAYNECISHLCEVQKFLEPIKMRNQIQTFFDGFNDKWTLFDEKVRDRFIEEHLSIIKSIDEVLKVQEF